MSITPRPLPVLLIMIMFMPTAPVLAAEGPAEPPGGPGALPGALRGPIELRSDVGSVASGGSVLRVGIRGELAPDRQQVHVTVQLNEMLTSSAYLTPAQAEALAEMLAASADALANGRDSWDSGSGFEVQTQGRGPAGTVEVQVREAGGSAFRTDRFTLDRENARALGRLLQQAAGSAQWLEGRLHVLREGAGDADAGDDEAAPPDPSAEGADEGEPFKPRPDARRFRADEQIRIGEGLVDWVEFSRGRCNLMLHNTGGSAQDVDVAVVVTNAEGVVIWRGTEAWAFSSLDAGERYLASLRVYFALPASLAHSVWRRQTDSEPAWFWIEQQ